MKGPVKNLNLSDIRVLYGRGTEHLPLSPMHIHLAGPDGEIHAATEVNLRITPTSVDVTGLERMIVTDNGAILLDEHGVEVLERIPEPAEDREKRIERTERIVIAIFALAMALAGVAVHAESGFAGWGWMQNLCTLILGGYGVGLLVVARMAERE